MQGARADQGTVTNGGPDLRPDAVRRLFEAVSLVAGRQRISVRMPPRIKPGRDPLLAIALVSRLRLRRVTLNGDWWRREGDAYLGFIGSDGRPVALLPTGYRRYAIVDPGSGTETPITASTAKQLQRTGYVFYPALPEGSLRLRDLLTFCFRGTARDLATLVLAGFAAGLLALVVPLATTFLFSHVIPSDSRSELVQVICILLVAAVGTGAFWLARAFAILRIRGRFTSSLQFAVWDRVLHLPPSFFRDYTAGDLATRALGAIAIRNLLTAGSVEALLTGIFSVSSLALLFFYDVPLALVALGFLVAVTVATAVSLRVQLRHSRALQRARTTISGLSVQLFAGIPKLRVAGAEERAFEVWNTRFMTQREATLRMTRAANALASCMAAVPILGSMVLFATVMNGDSSRLAAPQFLGFSAAFAQFLVAVLATTLALSLATSVIPVIEDIRPILRATSEADTSKRDPGELSGAVHLDHVSFRYGPQGSIVLDDVSLVAEPGERVAIVGPSGSGKSTILRLLLGFDRPTSGYVLYDGVDLAQLDVYAVREQIGSVLQDAQLMPTDILTNISGQLQLSPPEAWQAASLAEIAEDIRRLPMGMHTMVSEAGTTFSRGQRQRLLIARAIASRPKILIFDEATSALDNRTQESVMANLARLRITLITIAHRLSTVINADRIYVVIDGKVVASGTYEELLAHSTVFADLVRRQIV